jgi:aspartyl/asparaginyl beta-hydroxylase (cupin superfamily)
MDEQSCSFFDAGFEKKLNNNTRNHNDEEGDYLFGITISSIVCYIVFLVVCVLVGVLARTPALFPLLGVGLVSLFIGIGLSAHASAIFKARPMKAIWAASSKISKNVRTAAQLDPYEYFTGAKEFEGAHAQIKAEIMKINEDDLPLTKDTYSGENSYIGKDVRLDEKTGKTVGWRIFTVKVGHHITENARRQFPTLVNLIDKYKDEIISCAISVLPAQTKIPQHVGYFKGVLRYMLAIEIPQNSDDVYICVNDTKIKWEEGKSIMFDDTYPHKVFNLTDQRRIVLYMDIMRPLSGIWKQLTKYILKQMQDNPLIVNEIKQTEQLVEVETSTKTDESLTKKTEDLEDMDQTPMTEGSLKEYLEAESRRTYQRVASSEKARREWMENDGGFDLVGDLDPTVLDR